jgi:tetratricopeptide repeat protein
LNRVLCRDQARLRRFGSPVILGVALIMLVALEARADLSDDLSRASKQLELLETKANLIQNQYLQFSDPKSKSRLFENRLNDGQALMLLKDYVRAAIVFYDLVENEEYKDHVGYTDAVFSYSEALFFNKNFIDARKYYLQVIDSKRGRPYRKVALVRLMQIALNTEDYEVVDDAHRKLVEGSSKSSPEAEYLFGKTLFVRGKLEEAARAFSTLRKGESFYFQARYYLGVVFIRQGRHEDALNIYNALVQLTPKSEREVGVIELTHLARGRLLHDAQKEGEALDAYQSIEHTSPYFDDALFEICWTYVQQGEKSEQPEKRQAFLLEALRTLEILEVSTPDSTLVPQASLIKGHILEKMGKFEEAAKAFMVVSHNYATIKQQLDELVASHEDPVRYFNEVAGKNLDSFDLSTYLPPLAVKWMSGRDEMAAALGVMKDIESGRRFVKEARDLLVKLDALLAGKDRVNLFPALKEGTKRALEVENGRVLLERNLAQLEERIVIEHVSASERKEIDSARAERERLERLVDKLPTTKKDSDAREKKIRLQLEALERSVYESSIALKGMKAQLNAMEEWIRNNEKKLEGREEAVRDFREEIRRGWATANQLQADLDGLSNLLATEKAKAGLDHETLSKEGELKQQYSNALKKERSLAEQIHSRLGAEGTSQVTRINGMRLRADKLRQKISRINVEIDQKVKRKAKELQVQAEEEKKRLDVFEKSLAKLEQESENLAGEVAYQALEQVRQKFYRLVLDADVGVLDVAWSRKQEKTKSISELGKKLGQERKRLHDEFKSVLQEVE